MVGRPAAFLRICAAAAALLALQALALFLEGHPAICACGYVKLWEGAVNSAGNSQHLADWYSFTHLIHGFLLYAVLSLADRRRALSVGLRLVVAIAVEAAWEVGENTPFVIERYRATAIALGYYGDSIVNSLSDTVVMAAGFVLAWRLPAPAVATLAVALELFLAWAIHDNFSLNVIMLIHPFDAISAWQAGA